MTNPGNEADIHTPDSGEDADIPAEKPANPDNAEAHAVREDSESAEAPAGVEVAGSAETPAGVEDAKGEESVVGLDGVDGVEGAENTSQQELPLAIVGGEEFTELPKDLYIPPDALEVFLELFEGPLDLLLYLIKKQNLNILDINVAEITDQYIAYVELMQASQFELAADYLVMAATLAEIKSRILLPRQEEEEAAEDDPRMQLIRRLQEYERYKQAAQDIDAMPRMDRDIQMAKADLPEIEKVQADPDVELSEILQCLSRVLQRAEMFEHHHIQFETLSTREKMSEILIRISGHKFVSLGSLLMRDEGRLGVVVTILAMMELLKDALIEMVQSEPFGPIHVKSRSDEPTTVQETTD